MILASFICNILGILVGLLFAVCALRIAKHLVQDYHDIESGLKWLNAHKKKSLSNLNTSSQ